MLDLVDTAQAWANSLSLFEVLMMLLIAWATACVTSAVFYAGYRHSLVRSTAAFGLTVTTLLMIALILVAGLSA